MAKNHPSIFASTAHDSLSSEVPRGEYRRYDSIDDLPSALSGIGGSIDPDNFRTVVVMSSSTSHTPPSIGGITPASSAPIQRVSVIRYDQHGEESEPHFNLDESLIFADVEGRRWRLFAANQPQHYEVLSTDSSLAAALDLYNLPEANTGILADLDASGRTVNFSTGNPRSDRAFDP